MERGKIPFSRLQNIVPILSGLNVEVMHVGALHCNPEVIGTLIVIHYSKKRDFTPFHVHTEQAPLLPSYNTLLAK
jgi:hypothetical protein